ncbi:hypothetical protein DFH06DRAFT_1317608 [Mycena polygramma]|nr:hypothetical protein DFH06DRAFT_1317608 [Mycena polygramma]
MNPTPYSAPTFNFSPTASSFGQQTPSSSPSPVSHPPPFFPETPSSSVVPTGHSPPPSTPVLSPVVVDTIARNFRLEPPQLALLRLFVGFGSLGAGLSPPDLATRVFMLAAQLGEAAKRQRAARAEEQERVDYRAIWRDLKIRLEETFCFTRMQKQNIRGIVQDVIYDGNRTKFLTMHVDVIEVLKDRQVLLSLENIFGVPGREKSLAQMTRRQCSSVRNAWRADVITSIDAENFVRLEDFVYTSATKYRLGGVGEDLPQIYTVHAALLRRFVFDHPTLKAAPTEEEVPDSDVEYDAAEEQRPKKKVKKTKQPKVGKLAKGEDFWGRVDEWFKEQIALRGTSLTGPKWRSYVDELILDDKRKFRGLTPGAAASIPDQTSSPAGGSRNALLPMHPPQRLEAHYGDDQQRMLDMMQTQGVSNIV